MEEADQFSPKESFALIQSMIDKTRSNLSHNRIYFLLWGWITFIAISGQFILKVIVKSPYHYYVWLITFLGAGISIYYSAKHSSKRRVKTYIEESMGSLWFGMGLSFAVLSALFIKLGWENCFPFFIMMYGLGTFVSGRMLGFTPLIIGGLTNWALAIAAIWFPFDYQMIFADAAIVFSYIIPGYLLKETNT